MQLRPAHVTLCVQNALVLEPEQAINVVSFLLRCSSFSNSKIWSSNVDFVEPCTERQFKEYLCKRQFFMQAVIVPWIEGFGVSRISPETDGIHYSRLHDLDSNLSSTKETSSGRQSSFHTWKLIGTRSDISFLPRARNQPAAYWYCNHA